MASRLTQFTLRMNCRIRNVFHIALRSRERYTTTVLLEFPKSEEAARFLRLNTFAPFVGGEFNLLRGDEWLTLRLAEASPIGGHRPVECEKFSLIFTAGPEKPLQQGIHDFRHEILGDFELFITPVASPERDVNWYEASINREIGL